jgi:hypothetical protein
MKGAYSPGDTAHAQLSQQCIATKEKKYHSVRNGLEGAEREVIEPFVRKGSIFTQKYVLFNHVKLNTGDF